MDQLGLILQAAGLKEQAQWLERNVVKALTFSTVALVFGLIALVFFGVALYNGLTPYFGSTGAAAATAGAFALVAIIAVLVVVYGQSGVKKEARAAAGPQTSPEVGMPEAEDISARPLIPSGLAGLRAESLWDIGTLVAVGIVMGLQNRRADNSRQ
jgi:hypothetical protein